jgi:hypothetical protein
MDHGHRSACVIPRAVPLPSCIPGHDAWTGPPEWFAGRAEARVASGQSETSCHAIGQSSASRRVSCPHPNHSPAKGGRSSLPVQGRVVDFQSMPSFFSL